MEDSNRTGPSGGAAAGRPSLLKRRKFILAAAAVLVAMAFLVYIGVTQFSTYLVTVSEFVAEGDAVYGKQTRVAGQVVPDTVDWDTENMTLSFTLTEGDAILPVVYRGVVPDTFKEDGELVVEGKYEAEGVFKATKLMTKCASKYEVAEPG